MTPKDWFKAAQLETTLENAELYLTLLAEEAQELTEANNTVDILDAVGDMMFVAEGLRYINENLSEKDQAILAAKIQTNGAILATTAVLEDFRRHHSVELDLLIKEITRSNFSKFTQSETIALETMDKYSKLGITTSYIKTNQYYIIRVQNKTFVDNKFYTKNKILKATTFTPPFLKPLADML